MNRRAFLTGLAASGIASAFPGKPFPEMPWERLAVASYSFRSLIDTPRNRTAKNQANLIALKDFAGVMAKRFDIHGVELLGQHFPSTEPAYLRELRDAVHAAGSRIVNIPTSIGVSVYDADPAQRELAVSNGKKWIDVAVAVECESIRVHIQKAKSGSQDLKLAVETLLAIAAYGEKNGVTVHLENDDPVVEEAFFLVEIIDRANSRWLRALPDFCNSMLTGDEAFNYRAVTALFARASHICHVKDAEVEGAKTFRVDLPRTMRIAKQSGYQGYFSIEWEGAGDVWVENERLITEAFSSLR